VTSVQQPPPSPHPWRNRLDWPTCYPYSDAAYIHQLIAHDYQTRCSQNYLDTMRSVVHYLVSYVVRFLACYVVRSLPSFVVRSLPRSVDGSLPSSGVGSVPSSVVHSLVNSGVRSLPSSGVRSLVSLLLQDGRQCVAGLP